MPLDGVYFTQYDWFLELPNGTFSLRKFAVVVNVGLVLVVAGMACRFGVLPCLILEQQSRQVPKQQWKCKLQTKKDAHS
eukprot:4570769-Amphidinium_carterae.2